MGGRSRARKPRNSATFRLCPRPGAEDASDRVLVRVDGDPNYLPGFADNEYDGYDGALPSSSDAGGALPDHVRREILDLGLPDDGYNYLAHIREFRPSFSSTGGGGSSAAFIPSRRPPARSGLPLSVKAYDARCVEVGTGGTDNVTTAEVISISGSGGGGSSAASIPSQRPPARSGMGLPWSVKVYDTPCITFLPDGTEKVGTTQVFSISAPAVEAPIEEVIDPDVAKLLEENDVPQGASEDVTKLIEESNVPQGTSEEDGELEEGTSEDEELEDNFVIIANQPEEEEQMDLEDDFVIIANQLGEEEHAKEERLEGAWSMFADEQIELLSVGTKKAQKGFTGSSLRLV